MLQAELEEFERLKSVDEQVKGSAEDRTSVDGRDALLMSVHRALQLRKRLCREVEGPKTLFITKREVLEEIERVLEI